jgi:hypothetical protein
VHKPTFSPDNTPSLLLITIMIIGASCPDKESYHAINKTSTELWAVLVWHLRWEIFKLVDVRPPQLWVFQALLLLEVYEKMFSTRVLHERAHIHHATTIDLIRRGSPLVERSPADLPPGYQENAPGIPPPGTTFTAEWWSHWITREATRRVAFAAFLIDSIHATMFGHSTMMAAHEIGLLLPCDEALWSATDAAEIGRIESALRAHGVKPLSFLEGLQRTLKGHEVHTNAFGRSILMSGLLSVSFHMNQRDLQVDSLGVNPRGRRGGSRWRKSITRAFDLWMQSYEQAAGNGAGNMSGRCLDKDHALESRIALYYLAHISMHVDIVECQVFAGAKRVLGRPLGKQDIESAQRHIRTVWAPTADARAATFYALRFLCAVLLPSPAHVARPSSILDYAATRKNVLPSPCWVLYVAALVLFSYSYAVDGAAVLPAPADSSIDNHIRDMYSFLTRVDAISTPDDIVHHRLNGCRGMLRVLRHLFRNANWELLNEAADMLTNCIKMIG